MQIAILSMTIIWELTFLMNQVISLGVLIKSLITVLHYISDNSFLIFPLNVLFDTSSEQ